MNAELLISKNIINAINSNYSRTLMGVPEYSDLVIQLMKDLNPNRYRIHLLFLRSLFYE